MAIAFFGVIPLLVASIILGGLAGGFLTVAIPRLIDNPGLRFWDALRLVSTPSSHCPVCGQMLTWSERLPVIGYLRCRGRCSSCDATIPVWYLIVEVVSAFAVPLAVLAHPLSMASFIYLFATPIVLVVAGMQMAPYYGLRIAAGTIGLAGILFGLLASGTVPFSASAVVFIGLALAFSARVPLLDTAGVSPALATAGAAGAALAPWLGATAGMAIIGAAAVAAVCGQPDTRT